MNPHYHLHPPSQAIPNVVVRAHYTLPGCHIIIVVIHQRRHRPVCRLPPPSSSPLLPTADTTPPTTASPPPYLVLLLLPPCDPPPPSPSRPLRPLDYPWRRHGLACGVDTLPPGPTRQVPLPHLPSLSGYGPVAPGPPSQPPQCLGLLSGSRR
jgi:hypothetical protein